MAGSRRRAGAAGRLAAVAGLVTVAAMVHRGGGWTSARPGRLLEIDGIELDAHAAAQLHGGGSGSGKDVAARSSALSMQLSHMGAKDINKLLKNNEHGEIDGIALDSHAMKELRGGGASHHARAAHSAHKHARSASHAQLLVDEGKQDLDSRQWKAAVKLFARAKRIWKREGSAQYHWADSLEHDVLRLHPGAAAGSHTISTARHRAEEGRRPELRRAVNELSSGHAFRSLYGLLRDEHNVQKNVKAAQTGESAAQQAVQEAKRVLAPYRSLDAAPARTQALDQVKKGARTSAELDAAIAMAQKKLERTNKMQLLHQRAQIVKLARQLALAAENKAAQREVRLGNPPADLLRGQPQGAGVGAMAGADVGASPAQLEQVPLQTWSSGAGPRGQKAQWSIQGGKTMAYASDTGAHMPVAEQVHSAYVRQLQASGPGAGKVATMAGGSDAQTPYERFHHRGRFHFNLDQEQPRYPSAAPPFPPLELPQADEKAASQLQMQQKTKGSSKVPVLNINLPHGQVVPPGQYYMDGSLVEDPVGHWDYVGKLVPTSQRESAV